MHVDERLPQQLLLVLAGNADSALAAARLSAALRQQDVPVLLALPDGVAADSDLRYHGAQGIWRERHWLQRLQPSLVLGTDLSAFCRCALLAARSSGRRTLLWTEGGQRRPWWTGLARTRTLPRLAAADAHLVRWLRAEVLGLGAGRERLALAPLAAAASLLAAGAVKRS